MAETTEPPTERRRKRLEALVRIEDKVEEAAEAAADAAAHAVEATKAAEAAQLARVAKKAKATTATKATKAAKAAKTAKSKAGKAAQAAKAASKAAAPDASALMEATEALQTPTHVLDVRLTDDELARLTRLADQEGLPVSALARSLLVRALNKSGNP